MLLTDNDKKILGGFIEKEKSLVELITVIKSSQNTNDSLSKFLTFFQNLEGISEIENFSQKKDNICDYLISNFLTSYPKPSPRIYKMYFSPFAPKEAIPDSAKKMVEELKEEDNQAYRNQIIKENKESKNPLFLAIANGDDLSKIKSIVEQSKYSILACDSHGNTALHLSAVLGRAEVVNFFVNPSEGIGMHKKNNDGLQATHLAAIGGSEKTLAMLLNAGAEMTPPLEERGQTQVLPSKKTDNKVQAAEVYPAVTKIDKLSQADKALAPTNYSLSIFSNFTPKPQVDKAPFSMDNEEKEVLLSYLQANALIEARNLQQIWDSTFRKIRLLPQPTNKIQVNAFINRKIRYDDREGKKKLEKKAQEWSEKYLAILPTYTPSQSNPEVNKLLHTLILTNAHKTLQNYLDLNPSLKEIIFDMVPNLLVESVKSLNFESIKFLLEINSEHPQSLEATEEEGLITLALNQLLEMLALPEFAKNAKHIVNNKPKFSDATLQSLVNKINAAKNLIELLLPFASTELENKQSGNRGINLFEGATLQEKCTAALKTRNFKGIDKTYFTSIVKILETIQKFEQPIASATFSRAS